MFKQVMIGLLGICVVAILGTEAAAQRIIGGSGWTKGVSCEGISGSGAGNVTKDPKSVACDIAPTDQSQGLPGFVFCHNSGANTPPGIQPANFSGTFGDITPLNPALVDRNGRFTGAAVIATLTDDQLATLRSACPNQNYDAFDFVPIGPFQLIVELVREATGEVLATDVLICTLPHPETFGFDKKTELPERRQYDCHR